MITNEGGVLDITDGGTPVYNSATDQLFHFLPPRIDGSVSRSALAFSGGSAANFRDVDFSIGSLPSVTTDIVGLVQIQYSGGYEYLPADSWFVAGGSFLFVHKRFQDIGGGFANYPASIGIATIYRNGADLRFKEQLYLLDHYLAGPALALEAYTLNYRLFPAVFS